MVDFQPSEMQVPLELTIKNLGQCDQACLSRELFYSQKNVRDWRDLLSQGE